jgi:hypothetical protein
MEYFKKGVTAPDTSASHVKWDFSGLSRGDVWVGGSAAPAAGSPCWCPLLRAACARQLWLEQPPVLQAALFSFLYLDLLDCTGTLFSMVRPAGLHHAAAAAAGFQHEWRNDCLAVSHIDLLPQARQCDTRCTQLAGQIQIQALARFVPSACCCATAAT